MLGRVKMLGRVWPRYVSMRFWSATTPVLGTRIQSRSIYQPDKEQKVLFVGGKYSRQAKQCHGCGAYLVNTGDPTDTEVMMSMVKRRDLAKVRAKHMTLCTRCKALKQGQILEAKNVLAEVDPQIYKDQLRKLKNQYGLVLLVLDATDDGSMLRTLRNLVGRNPVVVCMTKCDLLPFEAREEARFNWWIRKRLNQRGIKPIGLFCVSGRTGENMDDMAEYLVDELRGRNLWVVGAANAGKSTLVHGLTKLFLDKHKIRGSKGSKRKKYVKQLEPTTSNLPGTTLMTTRIPCFRTDKTAMHDTPGIVRHPPTLPFPTRMKNQLLLNPLALPLVPKVMHLSENQALSIRIPPEYSDDRDAVDDIEDQDEIQHGEELVRILVSPISNPDEDNDEQDEFRVRSVFWSMGEDLHQCVRFDWLDRVPPIGQIPLETTKRNRWSKEKACEFLNKNLGDCQSEEELEKLYCRGDYQHYKFHQQATRQRPMKLLKEFSTTKSKEYDSNGAQELEVVFSEFGWFSLASFQHFNVQIWVNPKCEMDLSMYARIPMLPAFYNRYRDNAGAFYNPKHANDHDFDGNNASLAFEDWPTNNDKDLQKYQENKSSFTAVHEQEMEPADFLLGDLHDDDLDDDLDDVFVDEDGDWTLEDDDWDQTDTFVDDYPPAR